MLMFQNIEYFIRLALDKYNLEHYSYAVSVSIVYRLHSSFFFFVIYLNLKDKFSYDFFSSQSDQSKMNRKEEM